MKINKFDYLYNDNDGLGKIIDVKKSNVNNEQTEYHVVFPQKELIINNIDDYGYLNMSFVEKLINGEYSIDFSYNSSVRGMNYFDDKRIMGFSVDHNLIKGMIRGTKVYSVFVAFSKDNKISVECTCPYSFHCKHEAAFLVYIRIFLKENVKAIEERIKIIEEEGKSGSNKILKQINESKNEIIAMVEEYRNKSVDDKFISFAFGIKDYLDNLKSEEKIDLIDKLFFLRQYQISVYFIYLILVYLNDHLIDFDEALKNFSDSQKRYVYDCLNKIKAQTKSSYIFDYDGPLFLSIYNNDYYSIIDIIAKCSYYNSLLVALIKYLSNKIEVSDNNNTNIINICKIFKSTKACFDAIKGYLNRCDYGTMRKIVKRIASRDLFDDYTNLDYINSVSDEELFKETIKIVNPKTQIDFILKNDKRFYNINKHDTIALLFILHCEIENRGSSGVERLIRSSEVLSKYSFLFASGNYRFTYRDFRISSEELKEKDRDYIDSIIDIFDIKYRFSYDELTIKNTYYLFFNLFDELNQIVKIEETDVINVVALDFIRKPELSSLLIRYIYNGIKEKKKEEYENNEKAFLDLLIEKRRKKQDEEASQYLDEVRITSFSSIVPEEKVKLEYYIEEANFLGMSEYQLSLKVGIDKMYKIQNISRFFEDVRLNRYASYGKKLGFHHGVNNYDFPHDKILKYLIGGSRESEYVKKAIELSKYNIDYLMDNLIGEKIYLISHIIKNNTGRNYNYEYMDIIQEGYIVTDKDFDFHASIDNEFNISYFDNVPRNVIPGSDALYVFCDGFVYKIIDKQKQNLVNFLNKFNGANIKKNLHKFVATLYYGNEDIIYLNDEIKTKFLEKERIIHLYFDYNDKNINEKNIVFNLKIFDGNEELIKDIDKLSLNDKERINIISDYLTYLGFKGSSLSGEDKIYNFLRTDLNPLMRVCKVFLSEAIKNTKVVDFPKVKYRIQYENDMMSVFMQESQFSKEELNEIFNKIKKKKKYVLLKDNTIINIDNENAQNFVDIINDFKLDVRNLERPKPLPIYQVLKSYAYNEMIEVDDYALKMIERIANFKNYELPSFKGSDILRNYQLDGVKWLTILSGYKMGGILADDMGLGKTLQIIAMLRINYKDAPSLIVCPKSLIFNWVNEFKKFDDDSTLKVIFGSINDRKNMINNIKDNERVIYITSYDSLRNDVEMYKCNFQYIILDEAQAIKNMQTLKSQSVKLLKGEVRFALTGTPIENNILDLWSIFDFVLPGYFCEIGEFKDNYEHDSGYVKRVARKVSPFILRRSKKDVLKDLPEKFERIISVELKGEQLKLYHAYIEKAKEAMENEGTFAVLQFLTRLRQICVSPKTFIEDYNGESEKIDYAIELIKTYVEEGHKILLFSQFVSALNIMKQELIKNKIDFLMLTGETKAIDRIDMCNDFNKSDSKEKVFLISLKAGGNGLNLTGADTVIHIDPWWNVSAENQATDRAHRIGQNRNVEVVKMICSDSIEQRVIELQNLKKDLIDKVISNDESSITRLSHEDISFILS